MKQKRFLTNSGAVHTNLKRAMLFCLLLLTVIVLSSCYVEQDRVVDDPNGLTVGDGGQTFDTLFTPTPDPNLVVVTATPTIAPTPDSGQIDWDTWNFSGEEAPTSPPSNVISVDNGTIPTIPGQTAAPATPQPQSTISGATSSGTLKQGSSGPEVSQLQTRLKELEYYTGSVDGKFGGATVNALRAFQSANNLTADGVAGPSTLNAIYGFSAIKASASGNSGITTQTSNPATKATPKATAKATTAPIVSGRTDIYLRLGDSGGQVKTMQNRLIVLGYLSGTADGNFQEATQAAVAAFQKNNSLYNDGIAGPDTLSRLYSSSAKKSNSVVANLGALRRGMNGGSVRSLQQQLKNLGFYNGSVDGDFGAGTESAVIAFQSARGLTADGVAGTSTMNALFSGTSGGSSNINTPVSGGNRTPTSYGATANINGYQTISATSGSSSSNITALQDALRYNNCYNGSVDGHYGSGTTQAVSTYQQRRGLRVTGVAGPATLRLLYNSTPASGSYSKLEMGSSGSAVERLQYTLYELMYYDGNITGRYDDATRNAVLTFQQVNGLSVDGVAGETTQSRLFSSIAIPCNI